MSEEEFFQGLVGNRNDLRLAVDAMRSSGVSFCLIGGLAVNHYTEPMVTLDADFAIASATGTADSLRSAGFSVEEYPHSLNAQYPGSKLRFQITINSRYGSFPSRATTGVIFGVEMPIASLPDIVQGKLWAATDPQRRPTKRQKDALDLARLAEHHLEVFQLVPRGMIPSLDEIRPATE